MIISNVIMIIISVILIGVAATASFLYARAWTKALKEQLKELQENGGSIKNTNLH